jgi:hypothetical protein
MTGHGEMRFEKGEILGGMKGKWKEGKREKRKEGEEE